MSPPCAWMEAPHQQEKSRRMQEGGTSISARHQLREGGWGPHDHAAGDPATSVPHHWGYLQPVKAARCS